MGGLVQCTGVINDVIRDCDVMLRRDAQGRRSQWARVTAGLTNMAADGPGLRVTRLRQSESSARLPGAFSTGRHGRARGQGFLGSESSLKFLRVTQVPGSIGPGSARPIASVTQAFYSGAAAAQS